jgi:hypothetical protein
MVLIHSRFPFLFYSPNTNSLHQPFVFSLLSHLQLLETHYFKVIVNFTIRAADWHSIFFQFPLAKVHFRTNAAAPWPAIRMSCASAASETLRFLGLLRYGT